MLRLAPAPTPAYAGPMRQLLLPLACLALAGCATNDSPKFQRAADLTAASADPWENTNRKIYSFNMAFDRAVAKPVTRTYRAVVPVAARRGVSNFYSTTGEPLNFANAMLQGKVKRAFRAFDRLLINGVLGVGGLADHAATMGLPEHEHDFGQTLAVWGVQSGPYFVFPFLGPGTVRDHGGFLVDFAADPSDFAFAELLSRQERYVKLGFRVINIRSELMDGGDQFLRGSADEYATVRSAWLQLRRNQLYDGAPPGEDDEEVEPLPDTGRPVESPSPGEPPASTAQPAVEPRS